MNEPSVLDYVKSKIFFWRGERIAIPSEEELETESQPQVMVSPEAVPVADEHAPASPRPFEFPLETIGKLARIFLILGLAFFAQRGLEPPGRSHLVGIIFYLLAAAWLVWTNVLGDWKLTNLPTQGENPGATRFRPIGLWVSVPLLILAFVLFGDNHFSMTNVAVWLLGGAIFILTFWQFDSEDPFLVGRLRTRWQNFRSGGIRLSSWTLLVLLVFGIAAFYRFYRLDQVPAEMFSDHAEKLTDVGELLAGQTRIFFPRNTGREAFQMYLTAAMGLFFDTGLSFLSLKLGTAFSGLFTIPFIYLLGKEVANRRVGLWAMFFAGIAYWPNVISRVALRFTLYPAFTAPALYFLVRGLQRRSRNDFILSGIFLGLGLHGYSPFRFVPIVVLATIGLYLLHRQSQGDRLQAFWGLGLVSATSLVVFLPLLRYALSNSGMFSYRMMTRMGQAETAFPGNPVSIFFSNFWKTLVMFFWDNGQIWVHSIPNRPALGIVAAVFFFIGVVLVVIRYLRKRHWVDIFLLISIPLLLIPSILSLAFPAENPSLNRTGGALIPVFIIVGLAVDGLLTSLKRRQLAPMGNWVAGGLGLIFVIWAGSQNYDLVFNQFDQQFRQNAWNTSEMGAIIRQFTDTTGAEDSAWVVPYPHWVDTRLVGIRAGYPERDYALWGEEIPTTLSDPRPKLFLVKPEDTENLELLQNLYPSGVWRLYESLSAGRDFFMYSVPPTHP
jgi:hypothetical protein